jgi:hypothetical protein
MARTRKWNLRGKVRYLEGWLAEPGTAALLRDQARRELEGLLNQHEPYTLGYIANRLENLALWHNQSGAYAVLCGDEAGWGQLRLALEYDGWKLRIDYGKYEQALAQGRQLDYSWEHGLAARCLALAVTFRADAFADWCGQLMLRDATASEGFFRTWHRTPFHPFMARLYAIWRGCPIDTEAGPLRDTGIYQALLDGWDDDEQYAAALLRACDYHCTRAFQRQDECTEFWYAPFDVFPAEVLAVQRVRQELVGSAPMVSHPLLDTPLGRVPEVIALPQDELLQRVIARVQADLRVQTEVDPKRCPGE